MFNVNYNPDVLTCLANLSNDEVFTPPDVANQILDLLPEELWKDKTVTFLDPCTKSGIFLREITKRLLGGLEEEIPDLQTRIDHIFTNNIELTGISGPILSDISDHLPIFSCFTLGSKTNKKSKHSTRRFFSEDNMAIFERSLSSI